MSTDGTSLSRPTLVSEQTERALFRSLEHIRGAIDATLATLTKLDQEGIGDDGPRSVRYFNDYPHLAFDELTKAPTIGLRKELHAHLQMLLKLRHGQAAAFRAHHAWLVTKMVIDDSKRNQTAFHARAQKVLAAEMQKNVRSPPEAVVKKLQLEADVVLGHCVSAYVSQPSPRSMKVVLAAVGDSLILGSSTQAGAPAIALHTLQLTALGQTKQALSHYTAHPTPANLRRLTQQVATALTLGCSEVDVHEAIVAISKASTAHNSTASGPKR